MLMTRLSRLPCVHPARGARSHLVCRSCGHAELVAMSCKRRGFCPSCLGRRMSDSAVHLEQRVLPAVPIRHCIGSMPWGLRAPLGYDRVLCAQIVGAFVEDVRALTSRPDTSPLHRACAAVRVPCARQHAYRPSSYIDHRLPCVFSVRTTLRSPLRTHLPSRPSARRAFSCFVWTWRRRASRSIRGRSCRSPTPSLRLRARPTVMNVARRS